MEGRPRRRARGSILCLALASAPLLAWGADARPPNIVVLLADDLGFSDLGSYGGEIDTPALDGLADEGVRFTNFHTAASCAPTRAMLLTGVDSHLAGVPNIVEALPPEQRGSPYYRGSLRRDVATLAERLRAAGYRTSMAGKWHLGHAPEERPFRRGFERTFILADTGADNWEEKPYLPIYDVANWYADGEPAHLPPDFYSSRFFIDKTIEFIDAGDERPFFAYVAFQAVHIPVQAPREFTEKYLGVYDDGWHALRTARLARARLLGVVPASTDLKNVSTSTDWEALDAEERRYRSKAMAVYAGMVEAMDFHIGRLIEHLRRTGRYENTLFVFLSDNGPEGSDPLTSGSAISDWFMRSWLGRNGYDTAYETLGERGSFLSIGPSWASAAASPLDLYKFFASEGGTRVPLIVSGPGVRRGGRVSRAFSWVTDVYATLAELGGASADPDAAETPSGRSLAALLSDRGERVYGPDDAVGYEVGGNAALFKGDHKLVLNRPPVGDGRWHLYDLRSDPGEVRDLASIRPALFEDLRDSYERYAEANHVLPVPDAYDQRAQVERNALRQRLPRLAAFVLGGAVLLAILAVWLLRRTRRRRAL